eukprot:scaffold435_cov342-Pavlova_lutheri.AAC.15
MSSGRRHPQQIDEHVIRYGIEFGEYLYPARVSSWGQPPFTFTGRCTSCLALFPPSHSPRPSSPGTPARSPSTFPMQPVLLRLLSGPLARGNPSCVAPWRRSFPPFVVAPATAVPFHGFCPG